MLFKDVSDRKLIMRDIAEARKKLAEYKEGRYYSLVRLYSKSIIPALQQELKESIAVELYIAGSAPRSIIR